MQPENVWNSLEIAKLLVSLLTPVLVVLLGYWFNRRLKEMEQENQRRSEQIAQENQTCNQQYKEEQKRIRDEVERRHAPHIEFSIACNFLGPQEGAYVAEFVISAKNLSLIRHQFDRINLRVRGIKRDEPLELWEGHGDRLVFKHKLFETEIVPPDWKFIFVEPGVRQEICFTTRIDEEYRFISAMSEFYYNQPTPHNIERVFEVGISSS